MTRWLSLHVAYACRHSGACCASGWPLPVEAAKVPVLDRAVAEGRVTTLDGRTAWLVSHADAPPEMAGTFRLTAEGRCVFHHRQRKAGRECAVHAGLGHARLPAACQHFPRVCLVDDRGVHVTLSHYCPTAAALLFDHTGPIAIVEGPAAVPGREVPEGFDARGALPPLLTTGLLMDLDGYGAWERHMVDTLAGAPARGRSAADAVALLHDEAVALTRWRPGDGTLAAAVPRVRRVARDPQVQGFSTLELFESARAACAEPWTWPAPPTSLAALDARLVAGSWFRFDAVLRRYLAAHAFASWVAYHADQLTAVVTSLARALAVVRTEAARVAADAGRPLDPPLLLEAIRRADLLLVHYADRARLARPSVNGPHPHARASGPRCLTREGDIS